MTIWKATANSGKVYVDGKEITDATHSTNGLGASDGVFILGKAGDSVYIPTGTATQLTELTNLVEQLMIIIFSNQIKPTIPPSPPGVFTNLVGQLPVALLPSELSKLTGLVTSITQLKNSFK